LPPDTAVATYFRFADPVVLLRAPYRVSFAYAGSDRLWQNIWRDTAALPRAVRITVRNAATEQTLAVSTATLIRVGLSADCARSGNPTQCN
jgi:general secretion pathway protein J